MAWLGRVIMVVNDRCVTFDVSRASGGRFDQA
jgi:hypothetical protein